MDPLSQTWELASLMVASVVVSMLVVNVCILGEYVCGCLIVVNYMDACKALGFLIFLQQLNKWKLSVHGICFLVSRSVCLSGFSPFHFLFHISQ